MHAQAYQHIFKVENFHSAMLKTFPNRIVQDIERKRETLYSTHPIYRPNKKQLFGFRAVCCVYSFVCMCVCYFHYSSVYSIVACQSSRRYCRVSIFFFHFRSLFLLHSSSVDRCKRNMGKT